MDENELYEGFGLEVPEAEIENEPGPGGEEAAEGLETQTPAEGDPGTPVGGQEEAPAQLADPAGAEEQRRQETTRREAEQVHEGYAVRDAVDKAYADAFGGRVDPYTGKPITTKAEYGQYQAAFRAEQQRQKLEAMRAAGVDPEVIQSIVSEHPVVKEARTVIEQARAAERAAQETQAKGWYAQQLKQINALDPEAKAESLEALSARDPEQYARMLGMVGRGVSMVDAYKALNFDTLVGRRTAAAQQTVRNQAAGKAHLAPAGGQGKAGVEVPGDIRQMYRDLNPGMSDAQIREEYAKYVKQTGG